VTGELAGLAQKTAAQAAAVLRNGRHAVPKAFSGRIRGRLVRALGERAVTIERTAAIVAQTRSRLAGQPPASATPLVSLHDPDARPIRKGRIDRPAEFGYKAQVTGNGGRPRLPAGSWRVDPAHSHAWFAARVAGRPVRGRLPLAGGVLIGEPVEDSVTRCWPRGRARSAPGHRGWTGCWRGPASRTPGLSRR
jgi:hypothetical protein